jgi:rhodanese-related sulfurtransferase
MFGRRADADRVIPALWVGAEPSNADARRLERLGITAVVDLRAEPGRRAAWSPGVTVVRVALVDHGTPTIEQLSSAAEQTSRLLRDGQEVLVHCRAGMERSPTVACAVLMLQGWTLRDAYHRVTEARAGAVPTEGQLGALRDLERTQRASPPENA